MGFVSNQELVDVREMVADIRADSKESLQLRIDQIHICQLQLESLGNSFLL